MPQANNVLDYVDYFRQLAIKHKDIRHNPVSEDGDAPIGSKKFCRISAEEVLLALPKDVGFPLMPLELYDNNLATNDNLSIKGKHRGAFMVLQQAGVNAFKEQLQAYADCEKIVYEILQKIWADHYGPSVSRCQSPFGYFDFGSIEIIFVNGVFNGTEWGVRVEFSFEFQQTSQIAKVPAAGTFLP